jgi:GNAT superfamily N-acetyltransferase
VTVTLAPLGVADQRHSRWATSDWNHEWDDNKVSTETRILRAGDEAVLDNVAPGVFDDDLDPRLVIEFLEDERHHVAVSVDQGKVVGFASGVHYVHPDKPAELWINEVGVAPSHQGRGIGKAVMQAMLEHGKRLGCR